MVSLQVINALLNICLWFANAFFAKLLERVYIQTSRLEFQFTGKTFSLDSGEVSMLLGLKSVLNALSCHKINPNRSYISSSWVSLLIFLSLISLPSEIWIETGIDEMNNCRPSVANSTGVCSSPWDGHSAVGIASAALLIQKSAWIDSEWDIVYEGSSVNISLNDVHKSEIGNSVLPEAERRPLASKCKVHVLSCSKCGTLTVGKDNGTFDTIITNASIVDDPNHCRKTSDKNYCRGDLTYDRATGLAFFFWSIRVKDENGERRIATKGIEVLLNDRETERVLTTNETIWEIIPDDRRTRVYSISCSSTGLHWTDLTRAVSIYRTVQMESPGEKKANVNGNIKNVQPLTKTDVIKSLFALKAEDNGSNCNGLVPQYTRCGTFDISRASILLAVNSFAMLIYIGLSLAGRKQKYVTLPTNAAAWKRYAIGVREGGGDFIVTTETENLESRLMVVDVAKHMSVFFS